MEDETTTTTTTEDLEGVNTTTTTTQLPDAGNTTDRTTIAAGSSPMGMAAKRGEVAIDKEAEAHTLQEQSAEERLDDAKAEAMANHDREHAGDDADYETEISRDKVA